MCARFCYKMVHCGISIWSIAEFMRWVYCTLVDSFRKRYFPVVKMHMENYMYFVRNPTYQSQCWVFWLINCLFRFSKSTHRDLAVCSLVYVYTSLLIFSEIFEILLIGNETKLPLFEFEKYHVWFCHGSKLENNKQPRKFPMPTWIQSPNRQKVKMSNFDNLLIPQ